jgi:hypothetical protein
MTGFAARAAEVCGDRSFASLIRVLVVETSSRAGI